MSPPSADDSASIRQDALAIFQAGIVAADPFEAVKRHLRPALLENFLKVHVVAFGKAACAMAKAALEVIPPEKLAGKGLAVTNYGNESNIDHMDVFGAGHPLPDAAGLQAAQLIAERVQHAQAGELILVLVSGGASALIPYPAGQISLQEKIAATQLLLDSGATINQINCVRKHLSLLKGGGLARMAAPTPIHALILSDVLGDDVSAIASGPTVADPSTYADAIEVFNSKAIWNQVPATIRRHLEQGMQGLIPETPKPGDAIFNQCDHSLIGSNALSISAMQKAACNLGYESILYHERLCGEAREEAEILLCHAKTLKVNKPIALLAGGETTVTVKGNGRGGRNQEMALAVAVAAEHGCPSGNWTFLSAGTDGIDGPTDAAGGLIDRDSFKRMVQAGINPPERLNNNDSYPALARSGDLISTGATGTNVADLQILLIRPET